jgi:hypothetical protein
MVDMSMIDRSVLLAAVTLTAFFALVGILSADGVQGTDVGADITEDETWTAQGNPWSVMKDIKVTGNSVLTIDPGVVVEFPAKWTIGCDPGSRIEARGRADNRILFSSSAPAPAAGDWNTIETGYQGIFENCTFQYAKVGLWATSNARISHCNFNSSITGLYIKGNSVTVYECNGYGCSIGMAAENATSAKFIDCDTLNCPQGINLIGSTASSLVIGCTFERATTHAVGLQTTGQNNEVRDCLMKGGNNAIYATSSDYITIYNVTARDCINAAFEFADSSGSQMILKRSIAIDCNRGVYLRDVSGVQVTENSFKRCSIKLHGTNVGSAVVWENNFIGSGSHTSTGNAQITWYSGGRGNYWSGYGGQDSNGDGIGDTAFFIVDDILGLQEDSYPLMNPKDYNPPIAEAGPKVSVKQYLEFTLDGSASEDDSFIENWTWTIELPTGLMMLYGVKAKGTLDIAGLFDVTLMVTDSADRTAMDTTVLEIRDGDKPQFVEIRVLNETTTGDPLTFACVVRDNMNISKVWCIYRFGLSGASKRIDLEPQGGDLWAAEIIVPLKLGQQIFFAISARDDWDNVNRTREYAINVIDDDPPIIESQLPFNVTTGDKAYLNATITDNREVIGAAVEFWFHGSEHYSVNLTSMGLLWYEKITVPANALSPLSVRFNATDMDGNVGLSKVFEINVTDNDAPIMNIDDTVPNFHFGGEAPFRVKLSDNIGVSQAFVEVRYMTTDFEARPLYFDGEHYKTKVTIALDKGRLFYYRFMVIDDAGNKLITDEVKVELKSQHPTITTVPVSEAYENSEYTQVFEAEDPDNEAYELQWGMDSNATWLFIDIVEGRAYGTPTAADVGSYWVNITVADGEGGEAYHLYHITVFDINLPPSITITSPDDGIRVGKFFRATGRVEDDENNIQWVRGRIDGGQWMNLSLTGNLWSYEMETKDIEPGTHELEVETYDGTNPSDLKSVTFIVPKSDDKDDNPGFGTVLALAALAVIVFLSRRRRA